MATFKKDFLTSEYPELKGDDVALAAAIGNAENAYTVVRFQFSPGAEILFGTCEFDHQRTDYLNFHNAKVLWER